MDFADVGVLGTGLWEGEVVGNERFGRGDEPREVRDPFRGRRADDGTVRIAGMELSPERFPRTLAALEASFRDPYRGTRRRRYFPPGLKTSDAEAEAARRAIADAGLSPGDIDALLIQSFLPDEIQPKNAALVAHKLGLRRNVLAWEVDSICNTAVTHLLNASMLIRAGVATRVLCVQSAAYSRVSDPTSSSSIAEGDMASAFVVGPVAGSRASFAWRTDGALHAAIRLQWDAPAGAERRRWYEPARERLLIRFEDELQSRVMGEIVANVREVCSEALERAGMGVGELDLFIAHQPMSWNRALMEDALGLREGVAYDTFEEYGSINSAGISASLHHARLEGRLWRGARVLLFGPAAGYTYAAAAVCW